MRSPLLLLALAVPILVGSAVAFTALAGGAGGNTPVAPSSLGTLAGGFHPVAGFFKPDGTNVADCGTSYSCLEQGFGNISYRQGPKVALALFAKRIPEDKSIRIDCHRIAHYIGAAAFARYHGNVAKTFSQGQATCASGYYHGVLERAFIGVTSKAQLGTVARRLCKAVGIRPRGFLDYQCEHGLGHGLMIETGYNMPMSVSLCAALATPWDHLVCDGGVFMENINTSYGFKSAWLKSNDPLYPCSMVKGIDRRSCYVRASGRAMELNHHDHAATAATCARVPRTWTAYCFRGYGRDASVDVIYAIGKTLAACRLAKAWEGDCLYGAARTYLDQAGGLVGLPHARVLCNRAPVATRAACFSGIGLVLGMIYPTDATRRAACTKVTREYADACTKIAIGEVDARARLSWG